jgi:SAM-dependent methyltransferase
MNAADVLDRIKAVRWYHAFEVVPGIITPGICAFSAPASLNALGVPADLSGKKCLDVGTWDGPLAFEMEARGGEVYALDVQDPNCTAFNTAKEIRGSQVQYTQGSVYDIAQHFPGIAFDLITYFGVYYHLKDPIGAFESLSRALAVGGHLYLEGEILYNYSETINGQPSQLDNQALGNADVPLALCYTGEYKNASNWFVPNLACLRGWLEAAGLDLVHYGLHVFHDAPYPNQRIVGCAVRAADLAIIEETNIFGKNLSMPEGWYDQYVGLKKRRQSSPAGEGVSPSLPPPTLSIPQASAFKRFWRRLVG